MSATLRVMLFGVIGVMLFFVGLAVGIVSDSDVRSLMFWYLNHG